ncbi:unnamed protein product [Choristocarpus tenellus]
MCAATGLRGISNALMAVGLRTSTPQSFVEKTVPTLEELRSMSLAKAQRTIDGLRKHRVTDQEVQLLGVTSDLGERVDVQTCAGLMVLCGCQRGIRLTIHQMKFVCIITQSLRELFALAEGAFIALSPKLKGRGNGNNKGSVTCAKSDCAVREYFLLAENWLRLYGGLPLFVAEKRRELKGDTMKPVDSSPSHISAD